MSLRKKLLVPVLLIATAIGSYIYAVWIPETLEEADRARLRLIERHMDTVGEGLIPLLLGSQLDTVHENLSALLQKNADWISLRLFDAKNRRLYPSTDKPENSKRAPQHQHRIIHTLSYMGNALGRLELDIDDTVNAAREQQRTNRLARLILGLMATMLAITMLTLEWAIRRPLAQLANASVALSHQDFAAPLPHLGKDEMGALVASFASMRDSLRMEIGERCRAEEKLRQSEASYRSLVAAMAEGVVFCDASGAITTINPAAERTLAAAGIRPEQIGTPWYASPFISEDGSALRTDDHPAAVTLRTGAPQYDVTMGLSKPDGTILWISVNSQPLIRDGEAVPYAAVTTFRDITERVRMMSSLRQLSAAVEQSPVAVLITDTDGAIEYVNPAFCANSLYTAGDVLGKNPHILRDDALGADEYRGLWRSIKHGTSWHGFFHNMRKDNTRYWEEATIAPIRDAKGTITKFVGIQQDITARKEAEDKVQFLAHHDALTGLPNRPLARDRMEMTMRVAERLGTKVALLFLDLDGFKHINDSLGHYVGDALLSAVAERLQNVVRRTDTVARQGGDEFLLIIANIPDAEAAAAVSMATLERLAVPFTINDNEISVAGSIGIALYPNDGRDWDTLLKKADAAMYSAKEAGRGTYRFFTEQMNAEANEYMQLHGKLRRALERDEFVLYYQPQLDLKTNGVIGVEALIRWNNPDLGLVQPGRFISIAENSGLIVPIGAWALNQACRQAAAWRKAGLPDLTMAVNLSAVQFRSGDLLASVRKALSDAVLPPSLLELELTESILIKDTTKVLSMVHELKAMGIKLSIDDFGTGYSSLSYLKRFNADKVKIDQSFVRDVVIDPNSRAIIDSVIGIARALNIETIGEGVESAKVLDALRQQNCDQAQGFFFAKPMPGEQAGAFIRRNS